MRFRLLGFVLGLGLVTTVCGATLGGRWTLFDEGAEVVQTGTKPKTWAFELTSSESEGIIGGGIQFDQLNDPKFKKLTELSADYRALVGGVGGGSPRFAIGLDLNGDGVFEQAADGSGPDGNVFVYFGPVNNGFHEPTSNVWQNTGNLITATDNRWDCNQVGSSRYYDDYATALSLVGNKRIMYIYLVIDSGWLFDEQVVQVNNVTVNNSTLVAKKPQ
jgi:hypothetical protein